MNIPKIAVNIGKLIGAVTLVDRILPTVKKVWFFFKKDVPLVCCPGCNGDGEIVNSESKLIKCPRCEGKGVVKQTTVK